MYYVYQWRRSGEHHEGLFYAFFVFFNKMAAGLALLGSNLALEWAGYVTQTEPDVSKTRQDKTRQDKTHSSAPQHSTVLYSLL